MKKKIVRSTEIQNETPKKDIAEEIKNDSNPDGVEIKELPSHFLTYDIDSILVRKLKVKEVKFLSKLKENPSLEIIVKAHKNAILNYKIEEMLPVDVKALIMIIATLTEPNFRLNISYNCINPSCKHYTEPLFKSIKVDEIDYEELEDREFSYSDLKFTPLRIKDLLFFEKAENDIKERCEFYDEDDNSLVILTLSFTKEIGDLYEQGNYEEALEKFIDIYENVLGELDFTNELNTIADKLFPDIRPYKTKCPKCNSNIDVYLDLDFSKVYL